MPGTSESGPTTEINIPKSGDATTIGPIHNSLYVGSERSSAREGHIYDCPWT
jgi:hypothetical protein